MSVPEMESRQIVVTGASGYGRVLRAPSNVLLRQAVFALVNDRRLADVCAGDAP